MHLPQNHMMTLYYDYMNIILYVVITTQIKFF